MEQIERYSRNHEATALFTSIQNLISTYGGKYSKVVKALARPALPFGENGRNKKAEESAPDAQNEEVSKNRYSVLYKYNNQYQHVGCSSQAEAQSALGVLMTDGNRVPIGIYDSKTDLFEFEIIGQYFHSQDPISDQQSRLEEVLTISRALRRRDSSWQPGYLQKPSFFA